MKKSEITERLNQILKQIAVLLPNVDEQEVRTWLMAASLYVWAGNKWFAKEYAEVLPAFLGKNYTEAQVATALECAGKDREMLLPDFFEKIVEIDERDGTGHSRNIADDIGRFLAEVALVNGDFTMEEARAVGRISDLMLDYCDSWNITGGKQREYRMDMVTPLKTDSYSRLPQKAAGTKNSLKKAVEDHTESEEEGSFTLEIDLEQLQAVLGENALEQEQIGVKKTTPDTAKEEKETLESVLAELNSLVGLERVKTDVQSLLNFIKVCRLRTERGMKVPTISYHLVFTGNPGTGKTTVARMVAKLYHLMGVLPQGQLVETDRSGLVAGYLGQTAIKTQKVIQEALGGVLFIDEAYALANDEEDSYGKEAIETILKAMEDHRDELVVIVAGYDNLMHKFIDSNPGLRSRFNKYFCFPDYSGADLLLILKRFCDTNGYSLQEEAIPVLQEKLNQKYETRQEHFGNARAVRNLFEQAINHQANRLVAMETISNQALTELTLEDILPAMGAM